MITLLKRNGNRPNEFLVVEKLKEATHFDKDHLHMGLITPAIRNELTTQMKQKENTETPLVMASMGLGGETVNAESNTGEETPLVMATMNFSKKETKKQVVNIADNSGAEKPLLMPLMKF